MCVGGVEWGKARGRSTLTVLDPRGGEKQKGEPKKGCALQDTPPHRVALPLHTIHSVVMHNVDLPGVWYQGKEGTSREG